MVFAKGKRSAVGPTEVSKRTCWIPADSEGFPQSKDTKLYDNLFTTADHGPTLLNFIQGTSQLWKGILVGVLRWSEKSEKERKVQSLQFFPIPFKRRPTETPVMHSGAQKSIHSSTGSVSTVLSSSSHKKL